MAEYHTNEVDAFDRLVRLSNNLNLKLRDVAQRLVEERSTKP
jgi:AmiR/NasT family two-component response regulator